MDDKIFNKIQTDDDDVDDYKSLILTYYNQGKYAKKPIKIIESYRLINGTFLNHYDKSINKDISIKLNKYQIKDWKFSKLIRTIADFRFSTLVDLLDISDKLVLFCWDNLNKFRVVDVWENKYHWLNMNHRIVISENNYLSLEVPLFGGSGSKDGKYIMHVTIETIKKLTVPYDYFMCSTLVDFEEDTKKIIFIDDTNTTKNTKGTTFPDKSLIRKDEKGDPVCIICMDNKRSVTFLKCGHMVACYECAIKLEKKNKYINCPFCKQIVDEVIISTLN